MDLLILVFKSLLCSKNNFLDVALDRSTAVKQAFSQKLKLSIQEHVSGKFLKDYNK